MKILTPESAILNEISDGLLIKFPKVKLVDINFYTGLVTPDTIFVSDNLDPKRLVEAFGTRTGPHIVQYNKNFFEQDIEIAAALIESPDRYFENPASVLLKTLSKTQTLHFSSENDKMNLMNAATVFLTENVSVTVQDAAFRIIEELYMNAIFDAPAETQKTDQQEAYRPGISAQLILSLSDDYLGISCCDPFGSLVPTKLIRRLNEVYREGAGNVMQMNSARGAGIGCMLMFEQCSGLYLGVKPGKCTVVSALIPYRISNRQRAEFKKSLHIIEQA